MVGLSWAAPPFRYQFRRARAIDEVEVVASTRRGCELLWQSTRCSGSFSWTGWRG